MNNIIAGILGLFLGPVGLWYKGKWAAGFAWLAMGFIILLATGGVGIVIAPILWIGMAIHAFVAAPAATTAPANELPTTFSRRPTQCTTFRVNGEREHVMSVTKLQPLFITDLRLARTRLVAGLVLMLVIALPLGFAAALSSGDIKTVLMFFAVSFAVVGALNLALFVIRKKAVSEVQPRPPFVRSKSPLPNAIGIVSQ